MPVIAAIAVAASLAQLYQSEQARETNQAELSRIKGMYDDLTSKIPNYNVSIDAPPAQHQAMASSLPVNGPNIQAPNFDLSKLTPEQRQVVGNLTPIYANYIKENNPTVINTSADMQAGRDAQLKALNKYTSMADSNFDPEYQSTVTKAQNAAQQQAQAVNDSILQSAARRGVQNSGLTMAMQQAGSGQSMNNLANTNLDAATQSYHNKLNALSQGASLGGQIQNQDMSQQAQNAAIINAFNQRMQQGQQANENNRSNLANQANMFNLQNQQNVSDYNTGINNQFALANRSREDMMKQAAYQSALQQQGRNDMLGQQGYQNQMGQLQYNNNLANQLAQWNQYQKEYGNQMAGNEYANQVQATGGQASPMYGQIGMNTSNTQDRNTAIQGLGNIAMIYGQDQASQDNQSRSAANMANMAQYNKTGQWMTPDEQQQYSDQYNSY